MVVEGVQKAAACEFTNRGVERERWKSLTVDDLKTHVVATLPTEMQV